MTLWNPLIWVEGVPGCGKSTFAREVGRRLKLRVFAEPVETNPYLERFYRDPKKWATMMQMFLLMHRHVHQQLASFESLGIAGHGGAILDRSIAGDRVFAKFHRDAGNIEAIDWDTYEMAYNIMVRTLLPPTLLVFLDAQPETAFSRMKIRGREAERDVVPDYLIKLRDGYQELLQEAQRGIAPWAHAINVCRIPWDPDTITEEQWDAVALTVRGACRQQ